MGKPIKKRVTNNFDPAASWDRMDFDPNVPPFRPEAELKTNQDLVKTLPQLLCDVQEGLILVQKPGISANERDLWMLYAQKGIAALMARSALDNEKIQNKAMESSKTALTQAIGQLEQTIRNLNSENDKVARRVLILTILFGLFEGIQAWQALVSLLGK